MDAIMLLKKQHAEVKSLFVQFKQADDAAQQREIFEQIADSLAAHCAIEEQVFYPAVYLADLQDAAKEAVEEHLSAKRVIADLLEMEPMDPQYEAKVAVLNELVNHHVKEEQEFVFPAARGAIDSKELKAIGERMELMYEGLIDAGSPRNLVPGQTARAASLPVDGVGDDLMAEESWTHRVG